MASNGVLSTDEVIRGFRTLLDKAIKHVKANQALSAGWAGTEPEVNKYGPALCLYYSACRSDTAAPGVRLPSDGQMFKLLWVSTCPRKFILFFHRWAHVVPLIKSLTTDHKIDLERLLCDKLPISLPPVPSSHFPWAISAEESALNHVRSISDELHSLASDITRLPCFQYRYNPPPPLTLCNEFFTSYSTSPTSSTELITVMISSQMSAAEIIAHLGRHGCRNLTHHLDTTSFSNGPVNRGGVGEIYRGRLNDGRRVAIKTVFLRTDENERDHKYLKHAAQELHTWSKCRHRNVVPLLGVAEFRGQIAMLSPWMENGTLRDYVNRKPGADRCDLSTQVAQGLAYLHSIGIVHGDLKGANVLVSFDGIAALTDFDNAVLGDTTLQFTRTRAKEKMSIRWTAPEILTSEGECSPEADVYALGMTILETITGKVPFSRKNDIAVMFFVGVRKEIPEWPKEHISPSSAQGNKLWAMLVNCWWHVPQGRPSAELVYQTMKAINPEGIVSRPEI